MANRALNFLAGIFAALVVAWLISLAPAQSPTPTPPQGGIFPITNGKLMTVLDANNFQIQNLDTSNLPVGGGSPGPGTGTITGITGDDGSATGLSITVGTATPAVPSLTLGGTLAIAHGGTGAADAAGAKVNFGLGNVNDTSDLAKPVSTPQQTALDLKANSSAMTDALALKADTTALTSGLATKEPLLPTTAFDAYVLARHNAGAGGTWYFVDPITLGTTSQSFTDGQSFTDNNYDSATAVFVAADVGKTITGTDIPVSTTIVSRTSATRVVLSNATTGTHGPGNTFTIINRLIPSAGGTGSVTNVATALSTPAAALLSSTVDNPSTSATINIGLTAASAGNMFWGTLGLSTAPHYLTQAEARTALGQTAAGTLLTTIAAPNAIAFPRFTGNPTNAVDTRTATQLAGDIGAESILTFSAPLVRSTPPAALNVISIPKATGSPAPLVVDGYLSGLDWITFNAKVPPGRTLAVTGPLTLLVGSTPTKDTFQDLSANRTFGIALATDSFDGYLSSTDHAKLTSAYSSSAAAVTNQTATSGTLTIPGNVTPFINKVVLNTALTGNLDIRLPPASVYNAANGYTSIEIADVSTAGNVQGTNTLKLKPVSSDTLDGQNSTNGITIPHSSTNWRVTSDGSGRWVSTAYTAFSVKDPITPTKEVVFDVSAQTPGAGYKILPSSVGNSVTVAITTASPGQFFNNINSNGVPDSAPVGETDVKPSQVPLGNLDTPTGALALNVDNVTTGIPNTGSNSTFAIVQPISSGLTRTYTLPEASKFQEGGKLYFYDATGSLSSQIGSKTTARLAVSAAGTINGAPTVDVTQPYAFRVLVARASTNNWSIDTSQAAGTLALDAWHNVTPVGGVATVPVTSAVDTNLAVVQMQGAIALNVPGLAPGMKGRIRFKDTSVAGGHVVTLPSGWRTPIAEGQGQFTTSTPSPTPTPGTTPTTEDEWQWDYDGNTANLTPMGKNMTASPPPAFSTKSDSGTASPTTAQNQGDTNSNEYVATWFIACGNAAGPCLTAETPYTVGRAELTVSKTGSPTYNGYVALWTDNGGTAGAGGTARPLALIAETSAVAVSTYSATSGVISYSFGTPATLIANHKYWLIYRGDNPSRTGLTDTVLGSTGLTASSSGTLVFSAADVAIRVSGTGIATNSVIATAPTTTTATMNFAATTGAGPALNLTYGPGNTSHFTTWKRAVGSTQDVLLSKTGGSWSIASSVSLMAYDLYK